MIDTRKMWRPLKTIAQIDFWRTMNNLTNRVQRCIDARWWLRWINYVLRKSIKCFLLLHSIIPFLLWTLLLSNWITFIVIQAVINYLLFNNCNLFVIQLLVSITITFLQNRHLIKDAQISDLSVANLTNITFLESSNLYYYANNYTRILRIITDNLVM